MDKQQKMIITALSALVAILLIVTLVLRLSGGKETVVGEFQPPEFDKLATLGTPQVDSSLNYKEISVAEGFKFSMCGNLTRQSDRCIIYFTSAPDNNVWLLVKIFDQSGNLLGQSGLLRPGEYVEYIALYSNVGANTPVTVKVLSYEPDTYISCGSAGANLVLK